MEVGTEPAVRNGPCADWTEFKVDLKSYYIDREVFLN